MSAGVLIREAAAEDAKAVIAVSRACAGTPNWSDAVWQQILAAPGGMRIVILAEWQGQCIGFVVVERTLDMTSLASIGVESGARGLGIGYALGLAATRWACDQGAATMELEVRASNEAALRLYGRLGFVEQGRRRGYYRSPAEDAVLMGLRLIEGSSLAAKV